MLTVIAAKHYLRGVPFTYGCQLFVRARRDKIVKRAGAVRWDLVVLVQTVVEHLILEPERSVIGSIGHRDLFRNVVLHAAVPRSTDLPFPGELEIAKRLAGHEIATGRGLSVRQPRNLTVREFPDRAVLDLPVRGGDAVVAETAPTVQRLPIE